MSITVPRLLCVLLYTNILINAENTTSNDQDERFHWKIPKRPHIIFILADDMGWNDISFHGSGEFLTPNIDALAYNGIQLHRLYASHVCTPSRSALMTGFHPIHTSMQHKVIYGEEPRGLPLQYKILPQYLNDLGYESHIAGKWHLGWWKKEYTPLYRGFKSHVGIWTGHHHYFDHWAREWGVGGLDMRQNMEPAWNLTGKYTTDVITERSVEVIKNHNVDKPLFLYVAHVACHSADPNDTLPAPADVVKKFSYIKDEQRRKFAAVTWKMDESVGKVIEALKDKNMLQDSIIIFSSDNGGAAAGFNLNAASNWPMRGVKNTLWEGGTRVAALIWSPLLKNQQRVSNQYMQFCDWLPTLYHAAGGNVRQLGEIDGINLWPALLDDLESPRTEIFHNIDDDFGNAALTQAEWKIMSGTMYEGFWDSWYGPSGRKYSYNYEEILESPAAKALRSIGFTVDIDKMKTLRNLADIKPFNNSITPCNLTAEICLFNILEDPTETNNLAYKYPNIVTKLLDRLCEINRTALPPNNKPLDPRADPKYFNWTWTNFGDYISEDQLSYTEPSSLFQKMKHLIENITDVLQIEENDGENVTPAKAIQDSSISNNPDLYGMRYVDVPEYDENMKKKLKQFVEQLQNQNLNEEYPEENSGTTSNPFRNVYKRFFLPSVISKDRQSEKFFNHAVLDNTDTQESTSGYQASRDDEEDVYSLDLSMFDNANNVVLI